MTDFKNYSNDELIFRMKKLVRTERKITHLVLLHIAEIEDRKIYAEKGYDGMYSYLTRGLGYSEGAAYRRLQSARLVKQVPTVAAKIEEGTINLSQLTQVQKCLKETQRTGEVVSKEKTLDVISKLENKNSFETQKAISIEFNLPVKTHEKLKPQKDDSVRIELTLSADQFAELTKAKELLSHVCPDGNWAEVISVLAKKFNQKKLEGRINTKTTQSVNAVGDSISSASLVPECGANVNTNSIKGINKATTASNKSKQAKPYREYISIQKKRALLKNANYCCEYKDHKTGYRCNSRYQLQVDHIEALALGGTNDFANLRILCRTHNDLAARKSGLSPQCVENPQVTH